MPKGNLAGKKTPSIEGGEGSRGRAGMNEVLVQPSNCVQGISRGRVDYGGNCFGTENVRTPTRGGKGVCVHELLIIRKAMSTPRRKKKAPKRTTAPPENQRKISQMLPKWNADDDLEKK